MKKIVKLLNTFILCFALMFVISVPAHADTGSNFSASIKCGSAEYGVLNGTKTYTLSPGRASIYVSNYTSGANYYITLYNGSEKISSDIAIHGTGWYTFSGLKDSSSNYHLKISLNGSANKTYTISGTVHDHAGN